MLEHPDWCYTTKGHFFNLLQAGTIINLWKGNKLKYDHLMHLFMMINNSLHALQIKNWHPILGSLLVRYTIDNKLSSSPIPHDALFSYSNTCSHISLDLKCQASQLASTAEWKYHIVWYIYIYISNHSVLDAYIRRKNES